MKASFDLRHGQKATIAEKQDPIIPVDIYRGEAGDSSLVSAGELSLPGPSTSVLIMGHAIAPKPGTREMAIHAHIGGVSQSAVVYGDRHWAGLTGFPTPTRPESFDRIDLTWENAFGGRDITPAREKDHEIRADNPVGKGFIARNSKRNPEEVQLPNLEHPRHLLKDPGDRPMPVGFGPVAPFWQPRIAYAGTYDQDWISNRAPLLPDDFDERFYQTAPRELIAKGYLVGGEACLLAGMTNEPELRFELPFVRPNIHVRFMHGGRRVPCVLDTVLVDADRKRLNLVWKGCASIHGRLEEVAAILAKVNSDV